MQGNLSEKHQFKDTMIQFETVSHFVYLIEFFDLCMVWRLDGESTSAATPETAQVEVQMQIQKMGVVITIWKL